jgi:hypothetical protein
MLLSNIFKTAAISVMMLSLALFAFSVVSPVSVDAGPYGSKPIKVCVKWVKLPWGPKICVQWKTIYIPTPVELPPIPPVDCLKCGVVIDPIRPVIDPVINPGQVFIPGR